jgi:hypothetical protein
MNLISWVTALQPFVDECMGRIAEVTNSSLNCTATMNLTLVGRAYSRAGPGFTSLSVEPAREPR